MKELEVTVHVWSATYSAVIAELCGRQFDREDSRTIANAEADEAVRVFIEKYIDG